jgi:hypothetical protein
MKFNEGLTFVEYNAQNEDLDYLGFIYRTGVYYDLEGNVRIDFPEFHGNVYYSCGPFINGYAAFQIQGADGDTYVTVIDKNGKKMFEPKIGYNFLSVGIDGYIIASVNNWEHHVMDINGNLIMAVTARDKKNNEISMSNGMLRIPGGGYLGSNDVYINLNEMTIIGRTGDGVSILNDGSVIERTGQGLTIITHSSYYQPITTVNDASDVNYYSQELLANIQRFQIGR